MNVELLTTLVVSRAILLHDLFTDLRDTKENTIDHLPDRTIELNRAGEFPTQLILQD